MQLSKTRWRKNVSQWVISKESNEICLKSVKKEKDYKIRQCTLCPKHDVHRVKVGSKMLWQISIIIRCKCFFFFMDRGPTTWPANNCLQIMVCSCAMPSNCVWLQIIFCSCVRKPCFSPSCDRSCVKMADRFASRGYSLKKQTRWSNDKTIIELGYRKITWFVSVSQINYLPKPNNWSAHHWQFTIFCSTSSNNC